MPVLVVREPARCLTIYLAGAIRNDESSDISWREEIITACQGLPAVFLNPLGGKYYDAVTKSWSVHQMVPSTAEFIVKQDFWCVDRADLVIFNFQSLSQKYPSIGSLVEFGRATARGSLIYSIVEADYEGHESPGMFKLHPFLAQSSTAIFHTVNDCKEFLIRHIPVLAGIDPHYKGTVHDQRSGEK